MMISSAAKALFVSYLVFMSTYQGDCSWHSSIRPISSVFLLGPDATKLHSIKRSVGQEPKTNGDLMNFPTNFMRRRDYRGKEKEKEQNSDLFLRLF